MRIIDMHLNPVKGRYLERLTQVSSSDLRDTADYFKGQFEDISVIKGVMVVLHSGIMADPGVENAFREVLADGRIVISYAPDFRSADSRSQLERAQSLGARFLKFHPYLQRIENEDYPACAELARHAEKLGMNIMVCCSYGTCMLDRHSGVRLTAFLAGHVSRPIVMSHAGGAKILDALLVAEAAPNVYLDTSFTLPYYNGSSVEKDIAFSMRKLGANRWVYGSDAPFVEMKESVRITLDFLQRYHFSDRDVESILYHTANGILHD